MAVRPAQTAAYDRRSVVHQKNGRTAPPQRHLMGLRLNHHTRRHARRWEAHVRRHVVCVAVDGPAQQQHDDERVAWI